VEFDHRAFPFGFGGRAFYPIAALLSIDFLIFLSFRARRVVILERR
jgi:hypothetical protein